MIGVKRFLSKWKCPKEIVKIFSKGAIISYYIYKVFDTILSIGRIVVNAIKANREDQAVVMAQEFFWEDFGIASKYGF